MKNLREIPVVVLTGSTDEADKEHTQMLQVESFLVKPVSLNKFLDVVRELKRFWHQGVILPSVSHGETSLSVWGRFLLSCPFVAEREPRAVFFG